MVNAMMPNFLIIGAMKAGTTSLFNYLKQHPQVYMPAVKEPRFFAIEGQDLKERERNLGRVWEGSVTQIADYKALFDRVTNEKAVGEASPLYLWSRQAPERIRHYIPKAKLIAILRHPADRAFSHFCHHVNRGFEPTTEFSKALQIDECRRQWLYIEQGMYSVLLNRYYQTFRHQQIRVYLYDDLEADSAGFLRDLFRFIEVEESCLPDTSKRYNISSIPRSRALDHFLSKDNIVKRVLNPFIPGKIRQRVRWHLQQLNSGRPKLYPGIRKELIGIYRKDILKLQKLIERDLSHWLE